MRQLQCLAIIIIQWGSCCFGSALDTTFDPRFSLGDKDEIALILDDNSKAILEENYRALCDGYQASAHIVRDKIAKLLMQANADATQASTIMLSVETARMSWEETRSQLEEEFYESTVSQLAENQLALFRYNLSTVRREKVLVEMRNANLLRQSQDLTSVLRSVLEPVKWTAVLKDIDYQYTYLLEPLMNEWDFRSRAAMQRKNVFAIDVSSNDRTREIMRIDRELRGLCDRVAKINEEFEGRFAASLEPLESERFLDECLRVEWPDLLYPSLPIIIIDQLQSEDLIPSQAAAIVEIRSTVEARERDCRRRCLRAIREWNSARNTKEVLKDVEGLQAQGKPAFEAWVDHPIIPLLWERRKISQDALSQIKAVLGTVESDKMTAISILLNHDSTPTGDPG